LEWTSKISQYELPHLWRKIVTTFETYWNNDEFERFTKSSILRFTAAVNRERRPAPGGDDLIPAFDLRPFPFHADSPDWSLRAMCLSVNLSHAGANQ
jgi:hypothetical protein